MPSWRAKKRNVLPYRVTSSECGTRIVHTAGVIHAMQNCIFGPLVLEIGKHERRFYVLPEGHVCLRIYVARQ